MVQSELLLTGIIEDSNDMDAVGLEVLVNGAAVGSWLGASISSVGGGATGAVPGSWDGRSVGSSVFGMFGGDVRGVLVTGEEGGNTLGSALGDRDGFGNSIGSAFGVWEGGDVGTGAGNCEGEGAGD